MKKCVLLMAAVALVMIGCAAPQKPLYYWNDYSHSLYNLKKNPSEETFASHKACLLQIIDDSTKNEVRVPPGVYGELGFMFMQENKSKEAVEYYRLEEQTYPESTPFMERLIASAKSETQSN